MTDSPETRPSLIARLQAGPDESAWEDFVALYRPVIVRLATRQGLQHSDAEDVAQVVLLSIANRISEWKFDPERARFRTWLHRIVRNSTINALVRRPSDRGAGGTTAMQSLAGLCADHDAVSAQLDDEWRREVFRWASDEVRHEIHATTWDAFWLSAVEGLDACEVAQRTGKSVGAVYVARTRVMQRLQEKVKGFADGSDDSEPDGDVKVPS